MPNEIILPSGLHLQNLLEVLRHLSWGASDILQAYARGKQPPYGFPKSLKIEDGGEGPVTAADLAVNTWLINGIKNHFPLADWLILSEEMVKQNFNPKEFIDSEWTWILDPLDGTKDFLQGSSDYAVHLALVKNNRPVLGVVLIPELEELWFGIGKNNCWKEDRKGNKLNAKFSQRKDIDELILIASRNHRYSILEELIGKLPIGRTDVKGSVGCKIASILRGETDFYISLSGKSSPKDWDMAAPEALIIAAGGSFSHPDGRLLKYKTNKFSQRGCLIASHGESHNKICEIVLDLLSTIDPNYEV